MAFLGKPLKFWGSQYRSNSDTHQAHKYQLGENKGCGGHLYFAIMLLLRPLTYHLSPQLREDDPSGFHLAVLHRRRGAFVFQIIINFSSILGATPSLQGGHTLLSGSHSDCRAVIPFSGSYSDCRAVIPFSGSHSDCRR